MKAGQLNACKFECGQFIIFATENTGPDFPPNGGLVRDIPGYFREIDWLVKYYEILASCM